MPNILNTRKLVNRDSATQLALNLIRNEMGIIPLELKIQFEIKSFEFWIGLVKDVISRDDVKRCQQLIKRQGRIKAE